MLFLLIRMFCSALSALFYHKQMLFIILIEPQRYEKDLIIVVFWENNLLLGEIAILPNCHFGHLDIWTFGNLDICFKGKHTGLPLLFFVDAVRLSC